MKSFKIILIVLLAVSAPIYGMHQTKSLVEWWAIVDAARSKKAIPAFSTEPDRVLYTMESPLHWAAACGDTELVVLLINVVHIPVDVRNSNGATALHKAARSLNVETVRALIRACADVDARDDNGATPLHLLFKRTDAKVIEIIKILIDEGHADVNAQDALGWTPLHCAVQKMNKDIIRLLVEHDANLKLTDREGNSPLHSQDASLQGELLGIVLEIEQRKKARAAQAAKIQKGIGEFVKRSHILAAQAKKVLTVVKEEEKQEAAQSVAKPVVAPVFVAPIPVKTVVLTEQAPSPVAFQTEADLPVTVQPSLLQKLTLFEEAVIAMVDDIIKVYEPTKATSEEAKEEKPKSPDAIRESITSTLRNSVEAIDTDKLMQLVWNQNLAAVYHYHHDMRDEVNARVRNVLARYAALELRHQPTRTSSEQTQSEQTISVDSARAVYSSAPKINESYIHSSQVLAISPRSKSALQEEFVMITQSV